MKKKITSKQLFRVMVIAMIAVTIILGGTYAWIRIGLSASKTNIIKAGSLDLRIDESPTDGSEVRLERAIPQSYRQGLTNKPYKFTLINNSTIDTDYTISLEDYYVDSDASLTNDQKIADSLIRYILVKNDDELIATNSKILEGNRTIDAGTISGKSGSTPTEIPYTLYVWIDSKAGDNATESDIMDKIFNARLNITAEQHHVAVTPTVTSLQPTYFEYGNPTTASSTTEPDGHNVFVGLSSEGNKGVCVKKGGTQCFQINNVEYEQTHIQEVFSDVTCISDNEYNKLVCNATDFKCEIRNDGGVYCTDHTNYEENCEVNHTGEVACEIIP